MGCDPLPVQMFSGPEVKISYKAEHFRRALTSCGPTATIQVVDPKKVPEGKPNPTLFEAEDYWHVLQPVAGFPREVVLTNTERDALKWAEEALHSVIVGDVVGKVLIGGGKVYLEIGAHLTMTQVLMQAPLLAEAEPMAQVAKS